MAPISGAASENQQSAYAKTKTQISCALTEHLFSAFVFATGIVESIFFLNLKSQSSSLLLGLYRPVCVGSGRKPRLLVISCKGSNVTGKKVIEMNCPEAVTFFFFLFF